MKTQMAMTLGAILVMGSLAARANDSVVLNSYHQQQKYCGVKFQAQSHAVVIGEIKGKARDVRDRSIDLNQKDIDSLTKKYMKNFAEKSDLEGQQGTYSYLSPNVHSSLRKNGALERGRDAVGGAIVKNFTIWGGFMDDTPAVDKASAQSQLALPVVFHANTTKAQLAQLMCQDLTSCQQDVASQELNDETKQDRITSIQETKTMLGCN